MIKIRIECLPEESRQAAEIIEKCFKVAAISAPYPNRGRSKFERTYIDAELPTAKNENTIQGDI